jgi:hypothetical protein
MDRKQTAWALIIGGALGVAGGLFLPWATLGALEISGAEGDGMIAAIAGALGITAGLLTLNSKGGIAPRVLGILATVGVLGVGVLDYPDIADAAGQSPLTQVGTGMYAVLLGGGILLVGTIFTFRIRTETARTVSTAEASDVEDQVRALMASDGLTWNQAWKRVQAERGQAEGS